MWNKSVTKTAPLYFLQMGRQDIFFLQLWLSSACGEPQVPVLISVFMADAVS
jgi:hypothetical protein